MVAPPLLMLVALSMGPSNLDNYLLIVGALAHFGGLLTSLNIDSVSHYSFRFFCGCFLWVFGIIGEAITVPDPTTLTFPISIAILGLGGLLLPFTEYLVHRGKQLDAGSNSWLLQAVIAMVRLLQ